MEPTGHPSDLRFSIMPLGLVVDNICFQSPLGVLPFCSPISNETPQVTYVLRLGGWERMQASQTPFLPNPASCLLVRSMDRSS